MKSFDACNFELWLIQNEKEKKNAALQISTYQTTHYHL